MYKKIKQTFFSKFEHLPQKARKMRQQRNDT